MPRFDIQSQNLPKTGKFLSGTLIKGIKPINDINHCRRVWCMINLKEQYRERDECSYEKIKDV